MKLAFRLSSFVFAFFCLSVGVAVQAQTPTPTPTPSPTPDPFLVQITSATPVPSPTPGQLALPESYVRDISGNGRFVVIESNGDIATPPPVVMADTPNNRDGNREIFLYDYAQRRMFQITDTKSALVAPTGTTPTSPLFQRNIVVEVSNNRPSISRDGKWIVFTSNATTPFAFDGDTDTNEAALRTDGNQEIFLYRIPDVAEVDLTSGVETPFTDLRQNVFTRITDTTASLVPRPGTDTVAPFVADDNRSPQINDLGTRITFGSTRNLTTINGRTNNDFGNGNGNPEIYVYNVLTPSFSQITSTTGQFVFNDNPSISGGTDGVPERIAWVSNATAMTDGNNANAAANNADGNAEVFFSDINGNSITQVTRTRTTTPGFVLNAFSPGRRFSRDGNFIAFESTATDPLNNADTQSGFDTVFIYNITAQTATAIGPRPANTEAEVAFRFPVFAEQIVNGQPQQRVVFTSSLNIKADGTRADLNDVTGLNPSRRVQVFSAPIGTASATNPVNVLTNTPGAVGATPQAFVSDTTERFAFTSAGAELGTGNPDLSIEVYYQVLPPTQGGNVLAPASMFQFFTGATERPVATPVPSPSPTPTPTPSPTPSATPLPGLAPGMLAILRTPDSVPLASSAQGLCPDGTTTCAAGSESGRRPSLPVELNGVSLSIANAAAGLYFVSPNEIQFVVPRGLAATTGTNTLPVVVRIRETDNGQAVVRTVRGQVQIVNAQPDIFTVGMNRAMVFNVTTGAMMVEPPEGFPVMTERMRMDGMGVETVPTVLRLILTGVRNVQASQVTITIGDRMFTGTSQISSVSPTQTPGFDQIDFVLRADVAGIGDQPI
ncbi:MAG: hypothetical protein ACRD9R_21090, partial [Pyrinomonadaceae bacterium]